MEEPKINTIELKKEMQKQYYLKNKDAILTRGKLYYNKNKEAIINKVYERVILNPELKKRQNVNYYASNKENLIEQAKKQYIDNKENILIRMKNKNQTKKNKIPIDDDIFIDSE